MKSLYKHIALLIGTALFVGSAHAVLYTFSDPIDGLQEVPPNASPASGTAFGTYDSATMTLSIGTSATGFIGPVIAAHIHGPAAPGVSAGVVFPLSGATGSTSYSSADVFVLTPAHEAAFLGGLWYVNIHSTVFPGGEIRGQLHPVPVPEPATMAALLLGAGAVVRRRRK